MAFAVPSSLAHRSIFGRLLTTCLVTMGVVAVTMSIVASGFSIYMGMWELSRRSDSALASLRPMVIEAMKPSSGAMMESSKGAIPMEAPKTAMPMEPSKTAMPMEPSKTAMPMMGNPLDCLSLDPDIRSAAVLDQNHTVRFSYGKARSWSTMPPPDDASGSDERWTLDAMTTRDRLATHGPGANITLYLEYKTANAKFRALKQFALFLGSGLVGLAFIAAVLMVTLQRQMKPVQTLTATMVAMANEDYTTELPRLGLTDEIGAMTRAVETCRRRLVDRARLRAEADQQHRTTADRNRSMEARVGQFRSAIRHALAEVAGHSDQMTAAADGLAGIAAQTSNRAVDAFQAIRQSSSNIGVVASASEELSASIREIEGQVELTRNIVVEATRSTARTSGVVKGLSIKADEIGTIIGLIQTIAAQTNLLALNATIEAARAGESGRGFAVVAHEVKLLADQTAQASKNVAEHIRAIQNASSGAVEAIGRIDATMVQAERFSSLISIAVERQSSATTEISRNAFDAARAAEAAAALMKKLAADVGETDQSAAQVHQSATDVGLQARGLSTTIDRFLDDTTQFDRPFIAQVA